MKQKLFLFVLMLLWQPAWVASPAFAQDRGPSYTSDVTVTKNATGDYTLIIGQPDATLMDRAEARWGADSVANLIGNWLDSRKAHFDELDAKKMQRQFDALPPGRRGTIRSEFDATGVE